MAEIPEAAISAAAGAIEREAVPGEAILMSGDLCKTLARAALEAAAPLLADKIASAILRYADEHEPLTGSGAYNAWHRHFEAASAVAAKAFGRDNLMAPVLAVILNEHMPPGTVGMVSRGPSGTSGVIARNVSKDDPHGR